MGKAARADMDSAPTGWGLFIKVARAESLPCVKGGGTAIAVTEGLERVRVRWVLPVRSQSPSHLRCQPPLHKGAFWFAL